jgi:hypothetical protein
MVVGGARSTDAGATSCGNGGYPATTGIAT